VLTKVTRGVVRHPFPGFVLAVALAVAFGARIPGLRTDVSPSTMMLVNDPHARVYEDAKVKFGSDDLTIVVVEAADVFSTVPLEAVERLSTELRGMDGVVRVDSLSTVHDISGTDDSLSTELLMRDGTPRDREGLEALRQASLRNPLIADNLVSRDARATGIYVYTDGPQGDVGYDARFSAAVETLVATVRGETGLEIYQVGRPYTQALLSSTLIGDQKTIMPICVAVITLVLVLMFRGAQAVAITAVARVISIAWALGAMALLDYPITLLTALVPMLLMTVGFTEDIHFFSEYQSLLRHGLAKRDALVAAADACAVPLFVTSFTTAVGFASFSLSDIVILQQFGHVAGIAFLASYCATLLVVPAMLRMWPARPPHPQATAQPSGTDWLSGSLVRLATTALDHRRATIGIWLVLTAAGLAASAWVYVDNYSAGFFRPDSEFHRRLDRVGEILTGQFVLFVVVDAPGGKAASSEVQRYAVALQSDINRLEHVTHTISAGDYISLMNREMNAGSGSFHRVPDDDELIAQYLVLLPPSDLDKYLSYDQASTNIVVRHDARSTAEFKQVIAEIEALVRRGAPPGVTVDVTSEGILQTRAADSLARGMVVGLTYTVGIVGVVCGLMFMSVRAVLLSLPPNLAPVALAFGAMGLFGIPLSVGTAMMAAVSVGIAVDDTVHYMARNSVLLDTLHDLRAAMQRTIESEGRAIVATSVALAGGFAVLLSSSFVPLAHFGGISALVMVVALLADLTLTPVLAGSTSLVTLWNVVGMKLRGDVTEVAPLFRGMTKWEARKAVLLGRVETVRGGDYALRRGEWSNDTMYLVLTGSLRVVDDRGAKSRTIAELSPGALFGEMALVDAGQRSADVVAAADSELLALSAADLQRLEKRFPRTALKLLRNLARILSERLRTSLTPVQPT